MCLAIGRHRAETPACAGSVARPRTLPRLARGTVPRLVGRPTGGLVLRDCRRSSLLLGNGNIVPTRRTNTMNETDFRKRLCDKFHHYDAYIFKVVGHLMQGSGHPDLYVAHKLWTGWLELKVDGNVLTPQQKLKLAHLRRQGVPAFVMRWVNGPEAIRLEFEDGVRLGEIDHTGTGADILRSLQVYSRLHIQQ